ncbi:MAG: lysine biosynthesis protein LysX [Conexivisphaerales archaeon]
MAEATIIFDRLRWEEKVLYEKGKELGIDISLEDIKAKPLNITKQGPVDGIAEVVLQRAISHYRGLYYSSILESMGHTVINSFIASLLSGNKLLTTLLLAKNGIPTPKTSIAFSMDSAIKEMEEMGFPVVLKPIVGSWGRMIARVNDREQAESILETRELLTDPQQQIYYLQEYVKRPPRDIRGIVINGRVCTTIYRYQPDDDWRTNIARGGRAGVLKADSELEDLMIKSAQVVGAKVVGVDAMETDKGYVIHEINSNLEFKGATDASQKDIAKEIMEYIKEVIRK